MMLIITLEIVGAVFVQQLETQNLRQFKNQISLQRYVSTNLTSQLSRSDSAAANKQIRILLSDANIPSTANARFALLTVRAPFVAPMKLIISRLLVKKPLMILSKR